MHEEFAPEFLSEEFMLDADNTEEEEAEGTEEDTEDATTAETEDEDELI